MLTQTLRGPERDGLLTRTVTPSVPVRTDDELTSPGLSLLDTICHLRAWAEEHVAEVDLAREEYERAPRTSRRVRGGSGRAGGWRVIS